MRYYAIVRTFPGWFQPRSTDRDERFRERTIRLVIAVVMTLTTLALVNSQIVFHDPWTPISYPSLFVTVLLFAGASALSVRQGRLVLSGWLLVFGWIITGVFVSVIGYGSAPALRASILISALIMGSVVLQRDYIFPIAIVCALLSGALSLMFQTGVEAANSGPVGDILANVVMFAAASAFLYLRGRESDDRLAAMRQLFAEAEQARHEADVANQQRIKAMQIAVNAAEKANMLKSQFLANTSHDLRTPLNAIIGYTEIMMGGMAGEFTPQQKRMHENIHASAQRLLTLINDILNLAKIESGTIDVTTATAAPQKIVNDIVESMQSLAQKKNIYLRTVCLENTPTIVITDVGKVQQIVSNLVGNAIKFTHEQGVTVEIGGADSVDEWRFRVIDQGIGMPPDAATYIFEKFRQVDGTDSRQYEGTGLGLAIVKSLVDLLHGRIEVETELGKGTTFIVTLPVIYERSGQPEQLAA
ncbi:MAG: hypothetical protein IT324_19860 [Anaerolineae bacterium]|nr:hypothetical protein [Anaerolineae bacterium]